MRRHVLSFAPDCNKFNSKILLLYVLSPDSY